MNRPSLPLFLSTVFTLPTLIAATSSHAESLYQSSVNHIYQVEDVVRDTETLLSAQSAYLPHGDEAFTLEGSTDITLEVEAAGNYKLYAWWPKIGDVTPGITYSFEDDAGVASTISKGQTDHIGQWVYLADVYLTSDMLHLRVTTGERQSLAVVDAFRLHLSGEDAVSLAVETSSLPIAEMGKPYQAQLIARSAFGDVTWSLGNRLPSGLSLNAFTGEISGMARESGEFQVIVYAMDDNGVMADASVKLLVTQGADAEGESSTSPLQPTRQLFSQAQTLSPEPTQSSFTALSSQPVTLLEELATMQEGTWKKVNLNNFSEVWPEAALRPLNYSSNPTPEKIILAWSSFAWDSNRGNIILYGGGHANYSGNDVYIWNGSTRNWQRAALASEITQDDFGNFRAIDDVDAAPSSAHTYDNNVFLPIADRFLTYGGAAYNNGGPYKRQLDASTTIATGPYTFDPNLADPNKVGGTTGSHVQRVNPYPEILGGNMWENRDVYQNVVDGEYPIRFVNGVTAVTEENGVDVVYVSAASGGTAHQLYKHTVNDINDPSGDTWEKVGRYWNAFNGQGAGAFSESRNIFVRTAGTGFVYWDLDYASGGNDNILFTPVDLTGEFSMRQIFGMDYIPLTDRFLLWGGDGNVWELIPPASEGDTWYIDKQSSFSVEAPNGEYGTGILGKWEFARDLNAFIGLQDIREGNVWLYKPVDWEAPAGINERPTVQLIQPLDSSEFYVEDTVIIDANASDNDGTVERIEYFVNGTRVATVAPTASTFAWSPSYAGAHQIYAVAYDNENASATSASITVQILGDNTAPSVNITAPTSGNELTLGGIYTITASATDPDGSVSEVQFYIDGVLLGTDSSAPYSTSWTPPSTGIYSLEAKATDNEGAEGTSTAVVVSVLDNNQAPSVSVTSPADNAAFIVGDTINIAASASDSDGSISKVEFFVGNTKVGEDTSAPYLASWSADSAGSYSITAIAHDNFNSTTVSTAVSIDVSSSGGGDGSVSIVLRNGLDGYQGTTDTYLSRWHKTSNFGGQSDLLDQNGTYQQLIKFAIFQSEGGPVPDGAIIETASLHLFKYSYYDYNYALHPVLKAWSESQATWNQATNELPWDLPGILQPGLDIAIGAVAQGRAGWNPGWTEFDITSHLQSLSDGAVNLGWGIMPVSGNSNYRRFYSSEATTDLTLRPKLEVRFSVSGNARPQVSLTSPLSGSTVSLGQSYTMTADASDADGTIQKVEFYRNGSLVGEDTSEPYRLEFIANAVGSYELTAKAFDNEGAATVSSTVGLSVYDPNLPPIVSLSTTPANAAVLGDSVTLTAEASDSDGSVQSVEFFINGSSVSIDSTAPFSVEWTPDTPGTYSLSASATDDSGASTSSDNLPFAVNLPDDGSTVSVTLQEGLAGYAGTQDTYLSRWHKTSNFGEQSGVLDQKGTYLPLIKFAVFESEGGPVPDGAIIESASLQLYKYSYYDYSYALHPVLKAWSESEATWNQAADGLPWDLPGTLQLGQDIATVAVSQGVASWNPGWTEFEITDHLQALSDGADNLGWGIMPVSGNSNYRRYYSSEYSTDASLRPKLEVRFTLSDNARPQVSLSSPAPDTMISLGEIFSLNADASDADGTIAKVEFYRNGAFIGVDETAPYTLQLTADTVGSFELTAKAFDDAGASTISSSVSISVYDPNLPPTVTITTLPAESAELGTTITLTAAADDNDGSVESVEFFADGISLGTVTSAPFSVDWTPGSPGNYSLAAMATDDSGASSVSDALAFTVNLPNDGSTVTVTLQDGLAGYDGTEDTYLSRWHKTTNFGSRTALYDQNGTYHQLLKFAIFQSEGGPIPDGAVIDSAELQLFKYSTYDHLYGLHTVLKSWSEQQSNWNEASAGVTWSAPGLETGTDISGTAVAQAVADWAPGWVTFDIGPQVQSIADGASNSGWAVRSISGNSNYKRYYSSEYSGDSSLRPRLVVTYSLP